MKELLEATKRTVSAGTYPGYPSTRLVIDDDRVGQDLTLPDGVWSTGVFIYPDDEQQRKLAERGYELDTFGRPLHPWLRDMLADPEVGVVTGLGEYWHWGPNRTADPIVINTDEDPKVLLIKRDDTGAWAIPGGFIDGDEPAVEAAKRELCEETGLIIHDDPLEIYSGVVADGRTTAHAWAETTALLWRVDGTPNVTGGDDAREARWFSYDELPDELHGSHAILIEAAYSRLHEARTSHAISIPATAKTFRHADGGHMAYHRHIVRAQDDAEYFVKSHDKHAFDDEIREAHSRQYLRKEHAMYEHLRRAGFGYAPDMVELVDDHSLVMPAYTTEEGWHWRAPTSKLGAYVTDIMSALDSLGRTEIPRDFHDAEGPAHEILTKLGWAALRQSEKQAIMRRLTGWLPDFGERFRASAQALMKDFDMLQAMSKSPSPEATVLTHHDLRQANIAWHPEHGAKIVDWSWTGLGQENSDATMLLIDLHKSGHDVSAYTDKFNESHALTLIGYWLAWCIVEPRSPESSVRFQQALSAVCAYDLLMKNR